MKDFVCTDTVAPLRTGPSHRAEMGSQILLGEQYIILDKVGDWTKIQTLFDNYAGWVDNDHFLHCPLEGNAESLVLSQGINASDSNGENVFIYPGSELYNISDNGKEFSVGTLKFKSATNLRALSLKESIVESAGRFINAPYLWGGRTAYGMDCSGLSQLCFKIHGENIPRDSYNQVIVGTTINLLNDAEPGDLLFFDNSEGKITHVGILYDTGHVIHASGDVRIDMIDHQGIFKKDHDSYTHKLRLIKRIDPKP